MMIGSVLGPVKLDRAVAGAAEKRFVQVRCGGALITALDPLGAQPGQLVLQGQRIREIGSAAPSAVTQPSASASRKPSRL